MYADFAREPIYLLAKAVKESNGIRGLFRTIKLFLAVDYPIAILSLFQVIEVNMLYRVLRVNFPCIHHDLNLTLAYLTFLISEIDMSPARTSHMEIYIVSIVPLESEI